MYTVYADPENKGYLTWFRSCDGERVSKWCYDKEDVRKFAKGYLDGCRYKIVYSTKT